MIILFVGLLLIIYGISAKKYSVSWGMFFVLLILGFQEGIPGDYMAYKYIYEHGGADPDDVFSTVKETEYSIIWLTQVLSRFINFHWFVFLTALVQCFAMGAMIKEHADKRYWSFGILLIFFTYNIMLIQMKAMRQGYAVDCLLLAYWLLGRRRFLLSILFAAIAYGFHNSSMIALPFFVFLFVMMFLKRKDEFGKIKRITVIDAKVEGKSFKYATFAAIGLFVFTVLKFTVIDSYVSPFVESLDFFEYGGYLDEMENRSLAWWIVLYNIVATFTSTLYFINEKDLYRKYLAFMSVASQFFYVGFFGMGSLFRLSMFFDIFSIVTFPNVATILHNTYGKKIALYYIIFNMAFFMYLSVMHMVSMNIQNGFGYGMFRFSFM